MTERKKSSDVLEWIRSELDAKGIVLDASSCGDLDLSSCKVVCLPLGLGKSLEELGRETRDQVVMVRVDEETSKTLDDWVQTGAVKSRSEAAALFIREGLKVRAAELEKLAEALQGVEEAREKLREEAREVFGDQDNEA